MEGFKDYEVKPETTVKAAKITFPAVAAGRGRWLVKVAGRKEKIAVSAQVRPSRGDFVVIEQREGVCGYVCPGEVFKDKYQAKG
ncbi:hypothetical protein [Marinimicrobium agarilyticum]|uniref:hypothetical protein n=1 Tax=Marinimicrobium agarilyticum TaxID=306546 RepID=UPI000401A695|nr:hypothetical protein [Marinimicrobium agarilyticum]